jgi:hypothetical protein
MTPIGAGKTYWMRPDSGMSVMMTSPKKPVTHTM